MVRRGRLVAHGLEVDGDAVRRADLVLAAITLADGTGIVEIDHEFLLQVMVDFLGSRGELLRQRQDGRLVRRKGRVQMQDGADVVVALLVLPDDLFVVGIGQEGQERAFDAEGRLDDIGDIARVLLLIEIRQILAGRVLMLRQVIIRAVGNAPELAPAKREQELEVRRRLGIEAQLLRVMVAQAKVLLLHAEGEQPLLAEAAPVGKPLEVRARLAEELQLHLLEFTHAENEVARCDLVAERLADLADAERQLAARGALHVDEVHKDALRRLRAEIHGVLRVLRDALERLEHQVELTDIREVVLAARRAADVLLVDEALHLGLREGVDGLRQLLAGLGAVVLDELVCTEALMALAAVHQRVGEAAEMAGSDPRLRVHEDRAVEADVIRVLLHELLPPGALDVVFHLDAEGAVVPGVGKAAVNFGASEHEAAVFAQSDELFHGFFSIFQHNFSSGTIHLEFLLHHDPK